jgi:hypothetical protein
MNALAAEIISIAKALPLTERAEIIESLVHSMRNDDQDIEALWAAEAEDRVEALLRGELTANPEPRILVEFRARQR